MNCINCGNELSTGDVFCRKCGSEIGGNDNSKFSEEITARELRLVVGLKKSQYYIPKWMEFNESDDKLARSWNWAAFFLTYLWLAYRKMYLHAVVTVAVILIGEIILPREARLVFLMIPVFFGTFGNALYYNYSKKKIIKIKKDFQQVENIDLVMINKGGTSIVGTILFMLACYAVIFIVILGIRLFTIYNY
ncbi:MAG: DUF2628 domain-containing protein [Bacillota bacterium]|nr:DUF2628 domain-containing protein [Bacillota bacterium]